MRVNWATLAAWAAVVLMGLFFVYDKFGGNANALVCRIGSLENRTTAIETALTIELKNINEKLTDIKREIKKR